MHKCMGTALVKAIRRTKGYRLHHPNRNGNPFNHRNTHTLPIWNFDTERMAKWIQKLKREQVTFIGCEWAFPKTLVPATFRYFTILRDPYARFLSNWRFDYKRTHMTVQQYYKNKKQPEFAQPNYYCWILSRGSMSLPLALKNLDIYERIAVMEDPTSIQRLRQIGLPVKHLRRENRSSRANLPPIPPGFQTQFKRENAMDYAIYEKAVQIAKRP